jgi:hypothetical protein
MALFGSISVSRATMKCGSPCGRRQPDDRASSGRAKSSLISDAHFTSDVIRTTIFIDIGAYDAGQVLRSAA